MSIRMGVAIAAGLFAAASLASGASAEMFAPAKPAKPKTVTVTGCATQGVPQFCVRLGAFNVTGASVPVPIGQMVKLTGTVSGDPSICSGTTLVNIKWTPARGKCSPAKDAK